ncbi:MULTISPECIES: hypothetical protein [Allobaculum]|uniref:hypothetical protein n=1 Tax=Allobaculum TaxID=174708 RepID=UPI001E2C7FCB|nr:MULTISPECIES: hypothetical protein [Allobaculum]UNT93150.1 hypothetical protein KWG61_14220 [Allobaculum sp. Allo2]
MSEMRIVAHVHDEVIIEADERNSVEEVCKLMSGVPDWAEGLVLNADGMSARSIGRTKTSSGMVTCT